MLSYAVFDGPCLAVKAPIDMVKYSLESCYEMLFFFMKRKSARSIFVMRCHFKMILLCRREQQDNCYFCSFFFACGAFGLILVHAFRCQGQAVKLHGWNHHTQWPLEEAPWNVTASPTDKQLDADIALLLSSGANVVRGTRHQLKT